MNTGGQAESLKGQVNPLKPTHPNHMIDVAARGSPVLIGHGVHAQYTEVFRTLDDVLLLNYGNHVSDRLSSGASEHVQVFRSAMFLAACFPVHDISFVARTSAHEPR